jgi:hypothetical protein
MYTYYYSRTFLSPRYCAVHSLELQILRRSVCQYLMMHRLAATVRRGVHSLSSRTPWASPQIKILTRGGASSLATFKYSSAAFSVPLTLPDHDLKAIKDTIEGLLLMSQLRYLCAFPSLCPVLRLTASPSPDFGPEGLPRLPKIESDEIAMRVFTHRSFAARPTHVFEDSPEDPSPDNEQSVVPAIVLRPPKR